MQKAAILITASEVSTAGQAGVLGIIGQRTGEAAVAEKAGVAAVTGLSESGQPKTGTFEIKT